MGPAPLQNLKRTGGGLFRSSSGEARSSCEGPTDRMARALRCVRGHGPLQNLGSISKGVPLSRIALVARYRHHPRLPAPPRAAFYS